MAEKKPLKITETVLRDAHQSLIATRMTTEQMLPIVDKMEERIWQFYLIGTKTRKRRINKGKN